MSTPVPCAPATTGSNTKPHGPYDATPKPATRPGPPPPATNTTPKPTTTGHSPTTTSPPNQHPPPNPALHTRPTPEQEYGYGYGYNPDTVPDPIEEPHRHQADVYDAHRYNLAA